VDGPGIVQRETRSRPPLGPPHLVEKTDVGVPQARIEEINGELHAYNSKGKDLPSLNQELRFPDKFPSEKSEKDALTKLMNLVADQCALHWNLHLSVDAYLRILRSKSAHKDAKVLLGSFFNVFESAVKNFAKEVQTIQKNLPKSLKPPKVFGFFLSLPEYSQVIKRSVLSVVEDFEEEPSHHLTVKLVSRITQLLNETRESLKTIVT
jgi:hypothetical protein